MYRSNGKHRIKTAFSGNNGSPRLRIALYSGASTGLGHMRRNLLIGQTVTCSPVQANVLMVAEAHLAGVFAMPPGMDCLALPAIRRKRDGRLVPRHLGISPQELINLRANTIRAALESFEPDVLLVDKLPRGRCGELEPSLKYLHAHGRTRFVLGLRDVLDAPDSLYSVGSPDANEDDSREYYDAVRGYYDLVWVFSDPAVYDLSREYRLPPEVAAKMRYAGYLDQVMRLRFADGANTTMFESLGLPPGRLVLCLVGGGSDGGRLAEAFAQAELPPETNGVILTGPQMPHEVQERLCRCAARHKRLRVVRFVNEPALLLQQADRVIAMGGYNTICEVLSFEKRALIVPRVKPREQLIRAERFHDLGLLDVLHPDALNPQALTDWLSRDQALVTGVRDRINFNGLARLPHLLQEVLALSSQRVQGPPRQRRIKRVAT